MRIVCLVIFLERTLVVNACECIAIKEKNHFYRFSKRFDFVLARESQDKIVLCPRLCSISALTKHLSLL